MNYTRPELLDRLAAEYVLGTLQGKARIRFEKLKAATPVIAKAVRDWEARTTALATAVPPVAPSPGLWSKLETSLGWTQPATEKQATAKPRRSLWIWLGGGASFALGLLLALGVTRFYPAEVLPRAVLADAAPPPKYVGLINNPAGQPVLVAMSTANSRQLAVRVIQPIKVPDGKVLELWAVPDGAAAFPLGVVPSSGKASVALLEDVDSLKGIAHLAISIEDAPITIRDSAPGLVIMAGNCAKLW